MGDRTVLLNMTMNTRMPAAHRLLLLLLSLALWTAQGGHSAASCSHLLSSQLYHKIEVRRRARSSRSLLSGLSIFPDDRTFSFTHHRRQE